MIAYNLLVISIQNRRKFRWLISWISVKFKKLKTSCVFTWLSTSAQETFKTLTFFETDSLNLCRLTLFAMNQIFLIQKLKELFRVKVNIALLQHMVYSIHSHIFYILEASSKRPHYFSLIGRKPNKILQFKWKKTYGTKIQTKIRFKIHAEGE